VDGSQIEELRRWGEQLSRDESDSELRSAGRAILLLIEENERLRAPSSPSGDDLPGGGDGDGPPPVEVDAAAYAARQRERRQREARSRRQKRWFHNAFRLALAGAIIAALVFATLAVGARLAAPSLDAMGPSGGVGVGPALLPTLKFSVGGSPTTLDHVHWRLDGTDVTNEALPFRDRLVFDGSELRDGPHTLQATASGGFPGSKTTKSWRFYVDTKGPDIKLDSPGARIPSGDPLRVRGTLEKGATLTENGRPVLVKKGRFTIAWATRPKKAVTLVATDTLRNATTKRISVLIQPRLPSHPIRAVHMTSDAWADDGLRNGVLALIAQGRINAVEIDLKEEGGKIGWNAPVPLAHTIGAVHTTMDLGQAVRTLHDKGVRVIGRLVCFNDPTYAQWAWQHGKRDQVIQSADGGYYGSTYGGFTNFANPVVRRYQIAIAVAAAKLGVDDVLYDYVRRPDGPLSTMHFPGLKSTPERSIASFLAETRAALKPYKIFLGASVFGVAATRPTEVAQDIPMMSEHLDYVAPMVYPSHWGPGEYGVSDPNSQPYDIVLRSLQDFQKDVRGTGARVVPWLQDFSLGVDYGPAQVDAEIQGANDAGIDEFLLWDPSVTYTAAALAPNAKKAKFAKKVAAAATTGAGTAKPDELGVVPVLMHHQIRLHGSEFDMTPSQLVGELTRLWRDGFYPVRAEDFVTGRMNVPKGKSPVVMTFDDADNNQVGFLPDGSVDPNTALGIMEAFAKSHSGFPAVATFYVPRNAFDGNGSTRGQTLRWLVEHGFELGNHTRDHTQLNQADDTEVQRELVLGDRVLSDRVAGYQAKTMALPLGALPDNRSLALRGSWHGQSYHFDGVFLAGAEPAPSPFSKKFDRGAIPRIRPNPNWDGSRDFTGGMWLDILEKNPGMRYVSDGDPAKITFPRSESRDLSPQYRSLANPY
jgi:peptidoglycan/xylan/chitin deacetylase (PgdA/CDA1 family)